MSSPISFKILFVRIILFVALCCALTFTPASALRTTNAELTVFSQVDAYLTSEMAEQRIPGISIVIVQGDQIVHLNGFGFADPSGSLMTPQTAMFIGSVTKSFTALAIRQSVEADQIDLATSVQHCLPWFYVSAHPKEYYLDADQILNLEASSHITIR